MKRARKLLSILLTALTVMSAFSVATPVVASDVQSTIADEIVFAGEASVEETEIAETEAEENTEPVVIGEDESRRTADTKHFIMSDGSRKAVIYGNAVHYADSNGKWQEIDNTLTYDSEKKEYRNKNNSFKATFKEDFGEENLFSLENEGYTISWEYEANAIKKLLTKTEYAEKEKPDDKVMQYAAQSEDKIKYKNFESDCELEYVVTDNGVKENIILNTKTNKNEFTFKVTAEDLTLSKNQDGSISAKNADGEEIFFIPAPFMYDSNNVYSYDVSYEIESKKDSYTITVAADKEWLKADERVYPVTIDPVIYTKQTSTSVSSTFVTEDLPTANYGSRQDIYIGDESANYGQCYAMFKNTLPTLNNGDMVVGASLGLYMHSTSFDGGSSKRQLDAHIITSSWEENSVTWNTKPTYNSVITDYCFMNDGEYGWKYFDITKAVKGWYEGTFSNYGILVKAHDETLTPARAIFRSENATSITEGIPYIAIAYRNNKGVEGYWSYSSFSNGVGGTASVNDYTGNLVYSVPLTSSVSEIMPVSLSLVYNTYCSNETYTAGKNSSNLMSVGKGWRLNYQQTLLMSSKYGLTGDDAENYPYVYTDGDGTEHYIAKTEDDDGNTVYKDEDGLGYTFSKPGGTTDFYRLTQDDGSYMTFNNCGNLSSVVDNSGNKITLTYDSANLMIQKITDGTGHTFTFTYTSGTNYISSITDNATRKTQLAISGGVLTDVTLIDSSKVYFRYYDTGENLLNYVWNTDGIGRRFTYTTQAKGRRVAQTFDFSADDVSLTNYAIGQVVTFDRTAYNTTVKRSPGVDGIHNTTNSSYGSDDIISTLQFDNFGRTVSQQVKYGNGEAVGAGTYTYTGDDEIESRNKIQSSATLNKNTVNLLTNGNAEGTGSWTLAGKYGDVAYTYGATTEEAFFGKQSIKITNTSLTKDSFVHIGQRVTGFKVGYNYTFSAYTKTTNLTLFNYSNLQGAYLKVIPRNSSGTAIEVKTSPIVKNNTSEDINNGWRRISVTLQVPTETTYLDVYMMFGNATGSAYFDGFQLEEGSVVNSVNLLQNGSFEQYSSTALTTWTPSSGVTYTANTNGASTANVRNGSASLKITGGGEDYIGFYQYVTVAPNEDDTYILSGWAAAYAVNKTNHSNAKFELAARVTYSVSDGTTVTQFKDSAEFNTTVSNWQYAATAFSLKYKKSSSSDTKTYTPTHIMVMPRYNLQANYAYFDHIQLIKDVAQSYVYDSEGNVTSVSANAEQKNNMTYDGDDLKTYTDAAGYTTTYTYDSNHRLTQIKSPRTIKNNYIYNNKGQVISTEIQDGGDGIKIKSYQTYTDAYSSYGLSAGAYLRTTTDEVGNITTYGYHLPTGAQASVTDGNNNKTTYGYTDDTYTKLQKVLGQHTSVVYGYDGNKVSSISLGYGTNNTYNETYSFEYDSFGNVLKTKVGSVALSTNTYATNNGVLLESTYGNNDGIKYSYTKSGDVSGIYYKDNANGQNTASYSTNPLFTWAYSSNGLPRIHKDGVTGYKYDYSYDSIGRLIRTDISKSSDSSYIGSTEYGYDVRNNLTSIVNDIGGNTYLQEYLYSKTDDVAESVAHAKDNLPTQYKYLGVRMNYYHDSLNRLYRRAVGTENNQILNQYYYTTTTGDDGVTYYSNQLSREIIEGVSYYFEYDGVGNIISIDKDTGLNTTASNYKEYTYDAINRLLSETNYNNNQVISYQYNHLGNIRYKTIETYSGEGLTGTCTTKVIEYIYGNDGKSGWNYLLTSYDEDGDDVVDENEKISYDEIGNPTTYRGATMAWRGRQLTGFTKNGITSTMTYDADGLRSSKTVAGVKTTYQYVGDKLFYENRGNGDSFYYFYDSYGKLSAIYHHRNGTKVAYHVVTNAQGDVISLYDWAGYLVAYYEYDAWGNCTITQDTSSTGIATLNPFRYRGYYYDTDLELYYLQSRYYDSEIGRFINPDGYITTGQGLMSYNMYAYCNNNPINMTDDAGNCPKWLSGVVNVVSGATQMIAGAALGATVGWTGIGAVAAGILIANGAATAAQGIGQIINDVTNSEAMFEDNILRTQARALGEELGGEVGGSNCELFYDAAVSASSLIATAVAIKPDILSALDGKMPQVVNSRLFSHNGGYGYKIGNSIEILYRNPNAQGGTGGTIFSYNGYWGKYRIDWDPAHSFHSHPPGHG